MILEVTELEYKDLECAAVSARGSVGIVLSQIGALVFSWGRYGHSPGRQTCHWQRMPVDHCTYPNPFGQPSGSGEVGGDVEELFGGEVLVSVACSIDKAMDAATARKGRLAAKLRGLGQRSLATW